MDFLNSEMGAVIDEVVHSERDRAMMKRRYIDGLTFAELAREFRLSDSQVKRVVNRWKVRIFAEYQKREKRT